MFCSFGNYSCRAGRQGKDNFWLHVLFIFLHLCEVCQRGKKKSHVNWLDWLDTGTNVHSSFMASWLSCLIIPAKETKDMNLVPNNLFFFFPSRIHTSPFPTSHLIKGRWTRGICAYGLGNSWCPLRGNKRKHNHIP